MALLMRDLGSRGGIGDGTGRAAASGAARIPAACCTWAHRRTRVPRVGGAVREQQEGGEGRKEKGRETKEKIKMGKRKRKKGEKEKEKRKKRKRRKRKGGAGAIRGGGRSRARCSVRSDSAARETRRRGRWNGDWYWCHNGD